MESSLSSSALFILLSLQGDGLAALFRADKEIIDRLVAEICKFSSTCGFKLSSRNFSLLKEVEKKSEDEVLVLFLVDEFEGSFDEFVLQASQSFASFRLEAAVDIKVKLEIANNSEELNVLKSALASYDVYILPPSKVRHGSYGDVYKCIHKTVDRLVIRAAKICDLSLINTNPRYNEGRLLRFCEGTEGSKYVVQCYRHFDIPEPMPMKRVILMEWFENGDLRGLLSQISKSPQTIYLMNSDIFLRFSSQILEAVAFLHKVDDDIFAGKPCILHRDIKPENVLITVEGFNSHRHHDHIDLSRVNLKLADLGLSKEIELGHAASSNGSRQGTLYYKSPERFLGHESCQSDDVWSTAILLVEMMCGGLCTHQPLLGDRILISDIGKISGVDPKAIKSKCLPWLNNFLEPVLAALRSEKKYRCTNPKELLAALRNCKQNEDLMYDVFLCYHPDDANFARNLEAQMSDRRLKVYRASPGIIATQKCSLLLNEAAICTRPFLEFSLQELHKRVFDYSNPKGMEVLNNILKAGPSRHSWDRVFKVQGCVITCQNHGQPPGSRIRFAEKIVKAFEDGRELEHVPSRFYFVLDLDWTQHQFQVASVLGSRTPVSIEVAENTLHPFADDATLQDVLSKKDQISIPELHKLISDKAAAFHCASQHMKLANANMQRIAHPDEGWVELGRMFTTSSGGHEAAIKKTDVGNLDVEAIFNILKHLQIDGIVDANVKHHAEKLVRFRHINQGHKETRLLGETSISSFLELRSSIQSLVDCLSDYDNQSIVSLSERYNLDIRRAVTDDLRIMLHSRVVIPVISQACIDAWSELVPPLHFDPALIYTCAAFAARTIAVHSRVMGSRVEHILPIIAPLQPNTTKISVKRSPCMPRWLFDSCRSTSPLFKDNLYLQFEEKKKYCQISPNGSIECQNHCLSPGMCISFTENFQKVFVNNTQLQPIPKFFFVLAEGLHPDRFQVSSSAESSQSVSFEPQDKSKIAFQLASLHLFNSFDSKELHHIWSMVNDERHCYKTEELGETEIANFCTTCLNTLDLNMQDQGLESRCVCRFEILESNDCFKNSAESHIDSESVYYRQMTEIQHTNCP